ncbi:hypothetical protein SAMN05443549_10865 [Flavobacterium fluvii]|uniref:Uncharacterized protein n=1 Tax=Flavobacterium fluvii TaxID=468056 RepID=A0A1M5NJT0_9FLAO|nr:DUF6678 family protein [Flavobacterium fluvii]SHG89781.1 hypothetical protein SAMN05443549_10865 [Flavobacterium fluvii]
MENTEKQKLYFDILGDPNSTEREKYKYYIQNDDYALILKDKVKKIVTEKGLSSIMNDTKWLKLQSSIKKLPFPPPYIEKLILENKAFEDVQINDAPEWFGDWSPFYQEGMCLFFAIEYMKVRPRYAEHAGNLVAPKIHDETEEFEQLLKELHIPYEEDNGTFMIYGYK